MQVRIVNVISMPPAGTGPAGEAIERIIRGNLEALKKSVHPIGKRYAVGGVEGRPELTVWRRSTGIRHGIHRFARWLLTL